MRKDSGVALETSAHTLEKFLRTSVAYTTMVSACKMMKNQVFVLRTHFQSSLLLGRLIFLFNGNSVPTMQSDFVSTIRNCAGMFY